MKKKKLLLPIIIICIVLIVISIGVIWYFTGPSSKIRGKGTTRLEQQPNIVLRIEKNMNCTPVSLCLYDDGTYELFTEYETCRPFQECIKRLHYTKSIKGKYNYELTKILDEASIRDNIEIDYKQIDYEIVSGLAFSNTSLNEKYNHNYIIEKGQKNKALEELLKDINVDLDICAIPDYI